VFRPRSKVLSNGFNQSESKDLNQYIDFSVTQILFVENIFEHKHVDERSKIMETGGWVGE
jgi:hypothetical protein